MTQAQQSEALRLADALAYCDASVASQAVADLRQQLESIGAGGVEPLRRRDHFPDARKMVHDQFRDGAKMMTQEPEGK